MARRGGMLKLGAFIHPTGSHVAAWLHPESQADAGSNFRHYVDLALGKKASQVGEPDMEEETRRIMDVLARQALRDWRAPPASVGKAA